MLLLEIPVCENHGQVREQSNPTERPLPARLGEITFEIFLTRCEVCDGYTPCPNSKRPSPDDRRAVLRGLIGWAGTCMASPWRTIGWFDEAVQANGSGPLRVRFRAETPQTSFGQAMDLLSETIRLIRALGLYGTVQYL